MKIAGRTALVTGAAKRIGREIALALVRRGARVIVHHHNSAREAEDLVSRIQSEGGEAAAVRGDLSRDVTIEEVCRDAEAALGPVSILVNNASLFFSTPLASVTEEEWTRTLDVNLKAPFFLARRLGLAMVASGGGKIVNIADWAAYRPYRDHVPYCVSKAGLVAMTAGLAKELAPTVQVNAVAPGPVLLPERGGTESVRGAVARTPLGRAGSPEDVVAAVLFLLEGSDFVTGAVIPVDGGRLID